MSAITHREGFMADVAIEAYGPALVGLQIDYSDI